MILAFASALRDDDPQNRLLLNALADRGEKFLFLNPLDANELGKLRLELAKGDARLFYESEDVTPTSIFHSRLWRTDCIADFPQYCAYPALFRQKADYFLREVMSCFGDAKCFPGQLDDIMAADTKSMLYRFAHACGLDVPERTVSSFRRPVCGPGYLKTLGYPFSITTTSEGGEEVAVTLMNSADKEDIDLLGLPWQWQTAIVPKRLVRCAAVGDRLWSYYLDGGQLSGRCLREAQDDGDELVWKETSLPRETRERLFELLEMFNLAYSAPEFLVDSDGRHILIDLNPCGDWYGFSNEDDGPDIARAIVEKL